VLSGYEIAMSDFIRATLTFVLSNFSLCFLVLGAFVALAALARTAKPVDGATVVDTLLAWHIFFAIGCSYFYNFVCHVFFGKMAAAFIGWANSPFQLEVGMASLGFSVIGFLAAFGSFDRRLMAVLASSVFLLGAAAGHAWQMITAHNFAPGNAGIVFYTDIFIPLIGLALLWQQHRWGRPARVARG